MKPKAFFTPAAIAGLAGRLGHRIDRSNVSRALAQFPLVGCAPTRPGARWRIPPDTVIDVLAACLARRHNRGKGPTGVSVRDHDAFLLPVAELMLDHPDLVELVPSSLADQVRTRREAEARRTRDRAEALKRFANRHRDVPQDMRWLMDGVDAQKVERWRR